MRFLGFHKKVVLFRKFFYILNEIRVLSSSMWVVFKNVVRSANAPMDLLAIQGVDRDGPFVGI